MNSHKKIYYVYEHWRSDKNIPFHVGKGSHSLANQLRYNRNRHHQAIVAKLNRLGDFVDVRIVLKHLTEEEAFIEEEKRIEFWISQGVKLTNIARGGAGGHSGCRHTEEWKKQNSKRMRALMADPERRKLRGQKRLGVKLTPEQRANYCGPKSSDHVEAMKRAAKGRKRPPPRSETHAANAQAALAAAMERKLSDPSYIAAREARRESKRLEKIRLAEEARSENAEIRFFQLVRSILNGTALLCKRCDELKAPQAFTKNKATKSGLSFYCGKCNSEIQKNLRTNLLKVIS